MLLKLLKKKPKVSLAFDKRDVWIGAYWTYIMGKSPIFLHDRVLYDKTYTLTVHVCIVPCLPIKLVWTHFQPWEPNA